MSKSAAGPNPVPNTVTIPGATAPRSVKILMRRGGNSGADRPNVSCTQHDHCCCCCHSARERAGHFPFPDGSAQCGSAQGTPSALGAGMPHRIGSASTYILLSLNAPTVRRMRSDSENSPAAAMVRLLRREALTEIGHKTSCRDRAADTAASEVRRCRSRFRLRATCCIHSSVGCWVMPASVTRRVSS